MVTRPRIGGWILSAIVAAGALWYLRDPSWVAEQTTGLRKWERAADGTRCRWSGRHASFFVTSDAARIVVPVATTFGGATDAPMLVTFSVDDERAGRVLLTHAGWTPVSLDMPPRGSRRVRRIDVRTSVTREGNRGVMIGEIVVER
jgi:hypothetical protein